MKKTAVEWLIEKLDQNFDYVADTLIEQAKEMEKEQIINSHVTGLIEPIIMKNYKGLSVDEIKVEITKQAEEYYNETFKNETK
jgi:hypothetical protein